VKVVVEGDVRETKTKQKKEDANEIFVRKTKTMRY